MVRHRAPALGKHTLFLLKAGFYDGADGPFFCPECALVEGFLSYSPSLEREIVVKRIDFERPRVEIVTLLGATRQDCPVLVLGESGDWPPEAQTSQETGHAYIAGGLQITTFLGRAYRSVVPHI